MPNCTPAKHDKCKAWRFVELTSPIEPHRPRFWIRFLQELTTVASTDEFIDFTDCAQWP